MNERHRRRRRIRLANQPDPQDPHRAAYWANHEAAAKWAFRALASELGQLSAEELRARTDALVGIAEEYGIPIEALVDWIHRQAPGKSWSAAEFTAFAQKYLDARKQLAAAAVAFGRCPHCDAPLQDAQEHVCPD